MRPLIFFILFSFSLFGQVDNLAITRFEKISSTINVNQIKVNAENSIFLATTNGVEVINNDDVKSYLVGKNILDVASISKMGNWAVDNNTIYNIESSKSIILNDKNATITCLDVFNNLLYIGTTKGLFIVDPTSQKIDVKNIKNSELKSNHINFVYSDSKGRCWLGTKNGEVRIEGDSWQSDHIDKDVTHYYENAEGMWFISTNEKKKQEMWLIDHFNRFYDAGFGKDLYKGQFNDFAIDSKGQLYFASDAFIRFNPYDDKTQNYTESAGLISQKCTTTVCDKNDVIWVGTAGEGLFRLDLKGDKSLNVACLIEKKPSCYGVSDAAIKVISSGGTPPFSYDWNDASLHGNNPKNLIASSYSVTVSDKDNNKQICSVVIPSAELFYIDVESLTPIKSYNGKEGKIKVKANGGAGGYKYLWSNGSSKESLDNLGAGIYGLTVTDKNKCTAVGEYQLSREKILPDLEVKKLEVGKTLRINELFFKADSSEVMPQSFAVLDEVLTFLKQNPSIVVEIGGHTNTIPSHDYCDKLSTERAKSIATYFYQNGIPIERLSYKGYGKRQAITNSVSLEGRQKNQRVEIKIIAI